MRWSAVYWRLERLRVHEIADIMVDAFGTVMSSAYAVAAQLRDLLQDRCRPRLHGPLLTPWARGYVEEGR